MKSYTSKEIRNVVMLGHSGSGKTTITESCLFKSGATKRCGKVDEGNTVSDYDPEEIKRHVSINSSILPVEWKLPVTSTSQEKLCFQLRLLTQR